MEMMKKLAILVVAIIASEFGYAADQCYSTQQSDSVVIQGKKLGGKCEMDSDCQGYNQKYGLHCDSNNHRCSSGPCVRENKKISKNGFGDKMDLCCSGLVEKKGKCVKETA